MIVAMCNGPFPDFNRKRGASTRLWKVQIKRKGHSDLVTIRENTKGARGGYMFHYHRPPSHHHHQFDHKLEFHVRIYTVSQQDVLQLEYLAHSWFYRA